MDAASNSLTQGTLHHMHLFFIDLSKTKNQVEDFNTEEKELYDKFKTQHGHTAEFNEIETILRVVNKAEGFDVSEDKDIDELISIVQFIESKFTG